MKNNNLLFSLFFCLLFQCSVAQAEIGEVTINGEVIPDVLFKGYTRRSTPDTICPPTSDTRIRDSAIKRMLLIMDARKRGLAIPERNQADMDKYSEELKQLGPDGAPDEITRAEFSRHSHEYSGYTSHFRIDVSHQEILDEYKRLIKAKDPRFTDVVIVRHTPADFATKENRDAAAELIEQGSTLEEVMEKFKDGYSQDHYTPNWTPVYTMYEYEGDGRELAAGSVIRIRDKNIIYIREVKRRSRLRPFTKYRNNDDNHVYKIIKNDLIRAVRLEQHRQLWAAADVREDGEPIELSDDYPSCS